MVARRRDERGRFAPRPGARPRRRGPGRVPVVTCIACGARLSRGWVARAVRSPHRWGYWMRSVAGRKGQRKEGDIPLATAPRDDVLRWLGADAECQAALCVQAVAWLLRAGWSLPALQILVEHLQAQGFVQRVVERVYATVARVRLRARSREGVPLRWRAARRATARAGDVVHNRGGLT